MTFLTSEGLCVKDLVAKIHRSVFTTWSQIYSHVSTKANVPTPPAVLQLLTVSRDCAQATSPPWEMGGSFVGILLWLSSCTSFFGSVQTSYFSSLYFNLFFTTKSNSEHLLKTNTQRKKHPDFFQFCCC